MTDEPTLAAFHRLAAAIEHDPELRKAAGELALRLIREDANLREELRREILVDELLQLPQRFAQFTEYVNAFIAAQLQHNERTDQAIAELKTDMAEVKADVAELKTDMAEVKADVAELKTDMAEVKTDVAELKQNYTRMSGQLSNLMGHDYEHRAIERARRLVRRHLGMEQAILLYSDRPVPSTFEQDVLIPAIREGRVTRQQADDLEDADCIIRCENPDGEIIYAVVEISTMVQDHDHNRALRRAEILSQATGLPTRAYVVGENEEDSDPQSGRATYLRYA